MKPSTALTTLVMTALFGMTLQGCTYIEERRDLMSGGTQRREAAAQADLDVERQRAANLNSQKNQREQELDQVNARLNAAQAALDQQDHRLSAALKAKKISQARYNELKRQTDGLKAEATSLKARNDSDAVRRSSPPDPAKQKQLDELDQRRRDLETALQAAVAK